MCCAASKGLLRGPFNANCHRIASESCEAAPVSSGSIRSRLAKQNCLARGPLHIHLLFGAPPLPGASGLRSDEYSFCIATYLSYRNLGLIGLGSAYIKSSVKLQR